MLFTQLARQGALIRVVPAADLTTVTPRRTKTHTVRVEDNDFQAFFGQHPRGGKASVASTDDTDINGQLPAQR